ncbi:DNA methyltransferase Dim-2 [Apophysomyces sp. BC1015]|nr:DNA methyltransferase Dim-2 [Apophysomyces sp. BC1015]KAG0180652.1 DNA methyltransferase Dim-2 [Apophysomyces sp. BC1021]
MESDTITVLDFKDLQKESVEVVIPLISRTRAFNCIAEANEEKQKIASKRQKQAPLTESMALNEFIDEESVDLLQPNEDYLEYGLDGFIIYDKFDDLVELSEQFGTVYFDGDIKDAKGNKKSVEHVPFRNYALGDLEVHYEEPVIWIESTFVHDKVYYKLGQPHPSYEQIYSKFKWRALLVKIVLNFIEKYTDVTLADTILGGRLNQFLVEKYPAKG